MDEILKAGTSLRRKRSGSNHVLLSSAEGMAARMARQGVGSHVLVDMASVALEEREKKARQQNRPVDDVKRVTV